MNVIDVYDDPQLEIFKEAVSGETETEIKKTASSINLLTKAQRDALRDDQFGYVMMTKEGNCERRFPINDLGNTFLSAIYFMKTAGQLPNAVQAMTASNISRAARVFGAPIDRTIHKIAARYPSMGHIWIEGQKDFDVEISEMEKLSNDDSTYVADLNDRYWGLTNIEKRYPLHNFEQVKLASQFFANHYKGFEPEERFEFACKIAARADDYGQVNSIWNPALCKYAGVEFGDRFEENIRDRIRLCETMKKNASPFVELWRNHEKLGSNKSVIAMEEFDKQAGLTRYYDKGIDDPYAAIHGNFFRKEAEEATTVGDARITESMLRSIDPSVFKRQFGETLWRSFDKAPIMILESLPTPEKLMIVDMVPAPVSGSLQK